MQKAAPDERVCFYCVALATRSTMTPPSGPLPGVVAEDIPETRRYRLKNKLLGPPLVTEQLHRSA